MFICPLQTFFTRIGNEVILSMVRLKLLKKDKMFEKKSQEIYNYMQIDK
jgi:hypothetical protein